MKKIFLSLVLTLSFVSFASADEAKLNAGIVPAVWYSATPVYEEDALNIYSALQNHSTTTFSGVATFYVDGAKVDEANFNSGPETLLELKGSWKAVKGKHDIKVGISQSSIGNDRLLAVETSEDELKVKEKYGLMAAADKVTEVVAKIVAATDGAVDSLADTLQSFKSDADVSTSTASTSEGQVLGASTSSPTTKAPTGVSKGFQVAYDQGIDIVSFVLHNWKWILIGIAIVFVLLKVVLRL